MSERSTHRTLRVEEVKVTQERLATPVPLAPLVTFDLNLSNLQDYLNKVSSVVNKNSLHIQSLTEEVNQRVSVSDGIELLETIVLAVPGEMGTRKHQISTWKEGINATSASLEGLGEKVQELEKFKKNVQKELKDLSAKVELKLDKSKFESEKESLEKKIDEKLSREAFNKKISSFEEMVRKVEDHFNTKSAEMDKKVSDVKTETLWKINDCEKLLKIRVNEQFVWDALATLEGKMKREAETQASLKLSQSQNLFEKLQKDLKRLEEELNSKLSDSKRVLIDLEKDLGKKLEESKFEAILQDLLANSKKDSSKELKDRVKTLEISIIELKSKITPDFSEDLSKLFAQIEYLRSELDKKAERDSVIDLFNTIKNSKPQVVQSNSSQEFTELWKFREKALEKFGKIDEKFEKLAKAMDLSIIKKAIASKADEDQTKGEFLSVGQRLVNLENQQIEIWKEIEKIQVSIKRLFQTLEELGNKSGFALISKKSWNAHCLSCGRGDSTYIPTIPHVQGYDGKFYKADLNTFRPAVTSNDWKTEDVEVFEHKSPITLNRTQKSGVNAILGKDLVKSLSTNALSPGKRFRPQSARK